LQWKFPRQVGLNLSSYEVTKYKINSHQDREHEMRFLGCLLVNLGPHFNLSKRFNLRILDLQFLLHFQTLRWEVHLIQSMRYLQIHLIITMKKVFRHSPHEYPRNIAPPRGANAPGTLPPPTFRIFTPHICDVVYSNNFVILSSY
jgi:hypothetical protein